MTLTDTLAGPPMPDPSPLTQFFWDGVKEKRLMILRCDNCGHYIHFPREMCRFCLATDLTPTEMSGQARLSTYTIPAQPFDPFNMARVPYILAVVELIEQEHLQMVTNIVDCEYDDLHIEMPLEVVFRELSPDLTLPMFRPAQTKATA